MDLKEKIRNIPDFPIPGILFRDITTLLADAGAFREVIDQLAARFKDEAIDYIVVIESRGFIFGAPLAAAIGAGLVPVRKPGKLPGETISEEYSLEYGTNKLEIHKDALPAGAKVVIMDDLLATGGTAAAACKLVEKLGAKVVSAAFIIELDDLHGRDKLPGYDIFTLVNY